MEDFEYINKLYGTTYKCNKDINWNFISFAFPLMEDFIERFQDKVNWDNIFQYQKLTEEFIEKQIKRPRGTLFFEYWDIIIKYQKLSESFIERHKDNLNWYAISKFQKLSEEFMEKHQDEIDWHTISKFQNLSEEFMEKYKDKLDWLYIAKYQDLSEAFIEKYFINETPYNCNFSNKQAFSNILASQTLSTEFMDKHKDKVDWTFVSCLQKLSEPFIEKYKNFVDWSSISKFQKLSEGFIEKHKDKVNWMFVSCFQKLSEPFIKKYAHKVDWNKISKFQKLSNSFIKKHYHLLNKDLISTYQTLSNSTIDYLSLKVFKYDLWQYKDAEFKKQQLIKTKKYECYDDYFIAYKAIRKDRYSIFNFQYQYLPGGTYESVCDCTKDDNSFGLNVGTYDFAESYLYGRKGIIIKCKVYYKDIGRIVHNGEKVRCFKITVLD